MVRGHSERVTDDEVTVRKEAVWLIANLTEGGSPEQIKTVIRADGLTHMSRALSKLDRPDTIVICLRGALPSSPPCLNRGCERGSKGRRRQPAGPAV